MAQTQSQLDEYKLRLGEAVVRTVDMKLVRRKSLENLARWKANGVWCSAYDEWYVLMTEASDDKIRAVLTGRNEDANRLRQSPPYTGILDQRLVVEIRNKWLRISS